jgi:four helix bundle protein
VQKVRVRGQTEDTANSVCRNIAEGFGCKHVEFGRFLVIARRSLNELRDAFRAAQLKRYVTAHDYEPIARLTHRLYPALAGLIAYLQTTPDPDPVPARGKPRTGRTDSKPVRTDRTPACTNPKPARTDRKPARTA